MIDLTQAVAAGRFTKTHGVKGELNMLTAIDPDLLAPGIPLIIPIDGIPVPFFIASARTRGYESALVTLDGINSDIEAKQFVGLDVYIMRAALPETDDDDEAGLYADDLEGFTVITPEGETVGTVTGIDTRTENALLLVSTPTGEEVMLPVADELVLGIDPHKHTIVMQIPDGLLSLNTKQI